MENNEKYQQIELDEFGGGKRTLVYIPIDKLFPHPDNPRKDLGDLTEMAESIRTNGVMQNLTVVPNVQTTDEYERMLDSDEKYSTAYKNHAIHHAFDGGYTVVIGHRRMAAAKEAGLTELPCVVVSMTYKEQIATMMTENVQRADLTVYEQAQGFRQLSMDLGMSVDTIAKQTGFSATTVRRRLKLCDLNQDTLKEVSGRQISMADLDRLDKIDDPRLRNNALKEIGTANFNRECQAAIDELEKKKKIAEWRAILTEAGMTEIKEKAAEDTRNYTRVAYLYGEDRSRAAIEKYLTEDRELFFYVNHYGYAGIVTPKTEAEKNSAAEKETKREQETAARTEACAGLAEAFGRAYRLRFDFIQGYTETEAKKHMVDIMRMGVECNLAREDEFSMFAFDRLLGYTGEQMVERDSDPEWDEIKGTVNGSPYKAMLAYVYATTGDYEELACYNSYTYSCNRGEYDHQGFGHKKLTIIYENLERLGYEMSDEEKALMDGTSELYYKKEE